MPNVVVLRVAAPVEELDFLMTRCLDRRWTDFDGIKLFSVVVADATDKLATVSVPDRLFIPTLIGLRVSSLPYQQILYSFWDKRTSLSETK
jgi:hypothetical protein